MLGIKSVEENFSTFKKCEEAFSKNPSESSAKTLVKMAMTGTTSVYYSAIIEEYYKNQGKLIPSADPKKGIKEIDFLHVMTSAHKTGGHTRVVERWIDSSKDNTTHSLIILNQENLEEIPDLLTQAVKSKNGEMRSLESTLTVSEKAFSLRQLATKAKYIILHHNPDDPIPLIALSDSSITAPIICMNHSGHTFWLGRDIVDFSIEIEKQQQNITQEKRGISKTRLINLPVDITQSLPQKGTLKALRNKFSADNKNSTILISVARECKYEPIKELNFIKTVSEILDNNPHASFIGIGMSSKTASWRDLQKEYPNRVHILGTVEYEKAKELLSISDIYLDSYPQSSWGSVVDAAKTAQLPCVSLQTPLGYSSLFEGSPLLCKDEVAFKETVNKLIDDKKYRKKCASEQYNAFIETHSTDAFIRDLKQCVEEARNAHDSNKKHAQPKEMILPVDEYRFIINTMEQVQSKKTFLNIFTFEKRRNKLYKAYVLKICGCTVLCYKKKYIKPFFV